MDFKEHKAIYLQIAERICDGILLDEYKEEDRIPSVRDYAALVEVNFNTVMRSFEHLQLLDIIYNKRGIGYFVASGAKKKILSARKAAFIKTDIHDFFRNIYVLNIPIEEIEAMYNEYIKQQEK